MFHVRKLIITSYRRKKYILWLVISIIFLVLLSSLISSISLGEGTMINNNFQHQITEIIGLLFLLYFWSTTIQQFNQNKVMQLLWSKKKEPISFISQIRLGIYSVYFLYIILSCITFSLIHWINIENIFSYINLLVSWSIILTMILIFSLITNSYASMIISLIIYSISYSINFIIFSTPIAFQETISYKLLTLIQYIFPRFDMLYSTNIWIERLRSLWWNLLYLACIYYLFIYIFLRNYNK